MKSAVRSVKNSSYASGVMAKYQGKPVCVVDLPKGTYKPNNNMINEMNQVN